MRTLKLVVSLLFLSLQSQAAVIILQRKTMVSYQGMRLFSDDRIYRATPTQMLFTPIRPDSRISIRATGTGIVSAEGPESPLDITFLQSGVDILSDNVNTRPYRLLSGARDFQFDPSRGVVEVQKPVSLEADIASPGAGHTVVYAVGIRTGDAPPLPNLPPRYEVRWSMSGGTGLYSSLTVEEYMVDP